MYEDKTDNPYGSVKRTDDRKSMYEDRTEERSIAVDRTAIELKMRLARDIFENKDRMKALLSWPDAKIKKCLPHEAQNEIYVGECCNELRHGKGVLIWSAEPTRFYEGMFQNGSKHGTGLQCYGNNVYLGDFVNGQPEDERGVFLWSNGDTYHGGFVNGVREGYGRWESGGERYEGQWQGNRANGKAVIRSGESEYSGEVRDGVRHGEGREVFGNGDRYQGAYCNGKPEGRGTYWWKDGAVYTGQFKNGLRHGQGVWRRGAEGYEGEYANDKRHGQGVYHWEDGATYVGHFANDLRQGHGQMSAADSTLYKGSWMQGLYHGQGAIFHHHVLFQKGLYEEGKCVLQTYPPQINAHKLHADTSDKHAFLDKHTSLDKQDPNASLQKQSRYSKQPSLSSHRTSLTSKKNHFHYKIIQSSNQVIDQSPEQKLPEVLKHMLPRRKRVPYFKNRSPPDKPLFSKTPAVLTKVSTPIKAAFPLQQLPNKKVAVEKHFRKSVKMTPQSLLAEAIATQLTPIKWKNFTQLGSY